MNDNIIAGGEIHAGGGYSEGTQEAYEAFVKQRNQSLAKARINALAEQATEVVEVVNPDTGITHHREFFDKEKFAELIVAECTAALFDESERLSGLYSDEDNWASAEEYEIRSNQCIDDIALIEKHFGVEL
jgi:hypothetical protein